MPIIAPEPSKKLSKFCAFLIVVGLLLAVFGYFGPFVKVPGGSFESGFSLKKLASNNETLINEEGRSISGFGALNFFAHATFILGIVTIAWFVLLCVLFIDNPELIYLVIGGLTVLFTILAFIMAFVVAGKYYDNFIPYLEEGAETPTQTLTIGYGPIFLLIGGLLFGGGTAGMAFATPKTVSLHQPG